MAPELETAQSVPGAEAPPPDPIRTEDDHLLRDYVESIRNALGEENADELRVLTDQLYVSEVAELLTILSEEERPKLIELIGENFDFAALTEVDEQIRIDVLDALPLHLIAAGFVELESDDAVYILEDLPENAQAEILRTIPTLDRLALQRALDYPEESAGRRMQSNFIAVPPFWTVGRAIDYMREASDLPEEFHDLFVVDPGYRLLGFVKLNRMLRSKRPVTIEAIMDEVQEISAETDQEDAARTFQKYDLTSAAVVDTGGRLVGVLTIDDIIDVVQEEADEDIRALAGVGDEEVSDSVRAITRSRLPWLCVNLATAVLASLVIGLFDATLEQMVALAILMPIVASMGGNAATQTMTVAVRALATHSLDPYNMGRGSAGNLCRLGQWRCICAAYGCGRNRLVWQCRPWFRHRRGDDCQYAGGSARRYSHPDHPRPFQDRSSDCLQRVRHDGNRCGRLLCVSWSGRPMVRDLSDYNQRRTREV